MVHEIEIRREVAHRLDAAFKVLSAKIGKHGSATHHLANVLGAMALAFTGSLSHCPYFLPQVNLWLSPLVPSNL